MPNLSLLPWPIGLLVWSRLRNAARSAENAGQPPLTHAKLFMISLLSTM